MLKRTPLYETHVAAGARMVDFGGWEMPVNYGSQIDEHHAVRRAAGMFDVSHMCPADIDGADAKRLLLRLVANNVEKLAVPGKALYTAMLNEAGGCVDDLIVYLRGQDSYRVVLNAATAEKDLAWIDALRRREDFNVEVTPRRDVAMIAVQGPQARQRFWDARPAARAATERLGLFFAAAVDAAAVPMFVARTGYTGEDGFELMLPAAAAAPLWRDLAAAGVRPCGLGARDTLRVEAGMNLYGQDMDESITPFEAGIGWTVDLRSPRDFIGRAALERQRAGGGIRQLVGLKLLDKGVLRAHQRVRTTHGDGDITSGTFAPSLGVSIALARVPAGVEVGSTVDVDLRGRMVAAQVVKHPFVRNGQVLV